MDRMMKQEKWTGTIPAQSGPIGHSWSEYPILPGDPLPTTLHLPSAPLGNELWQCPGGEHTHHWEHPIPLAGWWLSKIVLLWWIGKGSTFPLVFPHGLSMPFSPLGLGLCAWSLLVSLPACLCFGRGLVLSASIFRAYGFLLVEIWSLAPGFCSACSLLHCKFLGETSSSFISDLIGSV